MLGIVQCGNDTGRLVKGIIEWRSFGSYSFAIDFDAVFDRIGLSAQFTNHSAVDGYAPFFNPTLRLPARCQARAGDDLLQSLHGATRLFFLELIEIDDPARNFR